MRASLASLQRGSVWQNGACLRFGPPRILVIFGWVPQIFQFSPNSMQHWSWPYTRHFSVMPITLPVWSVNSSRTFFVTRIFHAKHKYPGPRYQTQRNQHTKSKIKKEWIRLNWAPNEKWPISTTYEFDLGHYY